MIPTLCERCSLPHAKSGSSTASNWLDGECVRRNWFGYGLPAQAIGPMRYGQPGDEPIYLNVYDKRSGGRMPKNRTTTIATDWNGYYHWLLAEAQVVRDKDHARFVANPTTGLRRQEHNQLYMDRVFFDSDGAGTWDQLWVALETAGVAAIFHESSSSVRKRTEARFAGLPEPPITDWHCELFLSERIFNPFCDPGTKPPADPRWRHHQTEFKRQDRFLTGFFSALAGFKGVGKRLVTPGDPPAETSCGFDLATGQMCHPRFLGCRHHPQGPLPEIHQTTGHYALNYNGLLAAIGYQPKPLLPPQPAKRTTHVYTTPDGVTKTHTIKSFNDQLYQDVKQAMSIRRYLEEVVGVSPTKENASGGTYYFCIVHNEAANSQPNREGFHVFTSANGIERWRCHGDCSTGGDLIHLAAAYWNYGRGKAAWRLARLAGLDPKKYRDEVEDAPVTIDAEFTAIVPEDDSDEVQCELGHVHHECAHGHETAPVRKLDPNLDWKQGPLANVADWIERWAPKLEDPAEIARPIARLLMEWGQKQFGEIVEDPVRVAHTIYTVLHEHFTMAQALGEVFTVERKMSQAWDRDKHPRTPGRGWLIRELGFVAATELSGAIFRDHLAEKRHNPDRSYNEQLRKTLGYGRLRPRERAFLMALEKHRATRVPHQPDGTATPEEQEAAAKAAKLHKGVSKQVLRPSGCRRFKEVRISNYNREVGEQQKVCEGKTCTICRQVELQHIWRLALPLWREELQHGKCYFTQLKLPSVDHLHEAKDYVRRHAGRPRLSVTSFDEQGRPVLTYACKTNLDRTYVASALFSYRCLRIRTPEGETPAEHVERRFDTETPEEALAVVIEQIALHHACAREAIRTEDVEELERFLEVTHRRQVVTRSKRGLRWPTREDLRNAGKKDEDEIELYPDEEVQSYRAVHVETGVVIGTRTHPWTMDDILEAAKHKAPQISAVRSRMLAEAAAPPALALARPPT